MEEFFNSIQNTLGQALPGLLGALAILVIGWVIAIALRAGVHKALGLVNINKLFGEKMDVARGASKLVYYLAFMFTLLAVFNALQLEIVSQPIQNLINSIFNFLPKLIAGLILTLVTWVIARLVRDVVTGALSATGVDQKIGPTMGAASISKTLGNVFYGFVFLVFLPAILSVLEITGLIQPAQNMINKIFGFFPNILAAVVIGFVGWFIAKIVHDVVANLLHAMGLDKVGEKIGLQGTMTLSRIVGLVVYIFLLLPVIVSALGELKIEAVSQPATDMLGTILNTLPNMIAAVIIIIVTYFVARLVAGLLVRLLDGMNFNSIPGKLGLKSSSNGGASQFVANTVVFFMMLFAAVEAANKVGFDQVSQLVTFFIQFGGQVLLGTMIIGIGLWIANLAHDSLAKAKGNAWTASLVRVVILGLVLAIGLRSMGVANDIVNTAFGLTLGAAAVAVALAFGLGGREAAGKLAQSWVNKMK